MQRKNRGNLFVISAPSGAGKTTLCRRVVASVEDLKLSVSFTTRRPREGEADDVDYTFISEPEFMTMIERSDFVEWARVHGNLYGTSKGRLEQLMDAGFDVILDIDTQGAKQIRETYDNGVFIFILPPSLKVLRERLENRKSDTAADIERRLNRALDEIKDFNMYDYVIVNDLLEKSLEGLEAVIKAERLRSCRADIGWLKEHILS